MTRDELQAFAERHMQAWGRRDPSALAANHSLDGVVESPMFATLRGRLAIEDAYRAYFTSFPDAEAAIDAIVIDPPQVAIFTTVHATHVNEFFAVPGTHRGVEITSSRLMTTRARAASSAHLRRGLLLVDRQDRAVHLTVRFD